MAIEAPIEDRAPAGETPRGGESTAVRLAARLVALMTIIVILYFGRAFFMTLVSATIITFILQPFVQFFMKFRIPRAMASFLVCAFFILLLYFTGLGLATQASGLLDDMPAYSKRISEVLETAAEQLREVEKQVTSIMPKKLADARPPAMEAPTTKKGRKTKTPQPQPDPTTPVVSEVRIVDDKSPLLEFLVAQKDALYDIALMVSFVPFLVYFMLSWSEHMQRAFLGLFEGPHRSVAAKSLEGVAYMARAYMAGNFVLGIFLAVLSTVFFVMMKLPYPLLVGPLSGFLSLVPYVGLPLAMVPPFLAALPIYANFAAYLIISSVVGILHLFALNLLYPKIVGGRVHLNPLAVTVALMFWGLIWGGLGLVLAVPIVAGVKAVCDNVNSLRPYGRLLGD
ncbi:MAG: AI-2E family transporter [Bryobacter sp.]|nr:AI-2E family transporter [Bryobacter sp.]